MELSRAVESLKAAELCLNESLVNSAANRAYYAMFQAAQVLSKLKALRVRNGHTEACTPVLIVT